MKRKELITTIITATILLAMSYMFSQLKDWNQNRIDNKIPMERELIELSIVISCVVSVVTLPIILLDTIHMREEADYRLKVSDSFPRKLAQFKRSRGMNRG